MPPVVRPTTGIRRTTTGFQLTIMAASILRASFLLLAFIPLIMATSYSTAPFVVTGNYELRRGLDLNRTSASPQSSASGRRSRSAAGAVFGDLIFRLENLDTLRRLGRSYHIPPIDRVSASTEHSISWRLSPFPCKSRGLCSWVTPPSLLPGHNSSCRLD